MSSAGTTIVAPSRSMAGAAREGEAGRRMVVEGAAGSEDRWPRFAATMPRILEQPSQFGSRCDEIGKRVAIEDGSKGVKCFRQCTLEHATRLNGADTRISEASDEFHIWLHPGHDLANVDIFGGFRQAQATVLASDRFDVATNPKLMNHLHKVVL
jgi:hypothetical protein